MVLDELIAMHCSRDYFGISLEKAGSFFSYLGLKIGKDVKDFGIFHQELMKEHECRINDILNRKGFEERLLKLYLSRISGTIILQKCCIEHGYSNEFAELYKKFKPSIRISPFRKEYWVYDKNYLQNNHKGQ